MSGLVHVDGSIGGGQILRTALSLSALTGKPFVIEHIRKKRNRPGLMRQHLTAVRATAQICGAELVGAELGSTELEFRPGPVQPGAYHFSIGTAGSACLVLQTVLPPLMVAAQPSQLTFEGGTHNPLAPPYPFLDRVFFPVLERQGVEIARSLERVGFYPAGGGLFHVNVQPIPRLGMLSLCERGKRRRLWAEAQATNPETQPTQVRMIEIYRQVAPNAKPVFWPAGGYQALTDVLNRTYDAVAFEQISVEDAADQLITELNEQLANAARS